MFFQNDDLIGELLKGLRGDACRSVTACAWLWRDMDGEAARGAGGCSPVVFEEEVEGLLEMEKIGGS